MVNTLQCTHIVLYFTRGHCSVCGKKKPVVHWVDKLGIRSFALCQGCAEAIVVIHQRQNR